MPPEESSQLSRTGGFSLPTGEGKNKSNSVLPFFLPMLSPLEAGFSLSSQSTILYVEYS
jgi:hypothetical protein